MRGMGRTQRIIHRKKLFDGQYTAAELHAKLAYPRDARCGGCRTNRIAIRIQTFVHLSDIEANARHALEIEIALGRLHTVQLVHGPGVRTGLIYACHLCAPAAEIAAAKGPSYAVVDIDRGPGEDKIISQVPLIGAG